MLPLLLAGFVVAIDPGHGGAFPHEGAHGPRRPGARRLYEKDVTLAIAKELARLVAQEGGTAVLTRDGDENVRLKDRPARANERRADLLISIHCNSMSTTGDRRSTRGVETYLLSPDPTDAEARILAERENTEAALLAKASADPVQAILEDLEVSQAHADSAQLAAAIQRRLVRATRSPNRGVRQAPFIVLAGARMPAALVEVGFISHPREGRLLGKASYQHVVARAIADGIADFRKDVELRRDGARASVAKAAGAPAQ